MQSFIYRKQIKNCFDISDINFRWLPCQRRRLRRYFQRTGRRLPHRTSEHRKHPGTPELFRRTEVFPPVGTWCCWVGCRCWVGRACTWGRRPALPPSAAILSCLLSTSSLRWSALLTLSPVSRIWYSLQFITWVCNKSVD